MPPAAKDIAVALELLNALSPIVCNGSRDSYFGKSRGVERACAYGFKFGLCREVDHDVRIAVAAHVCKCKIAYNFKPCRKVEFLYLRSAEYRVGRRIIRIRAAAGIAYRKRSGAIIEGDFRKIFAAIECASANGFNRLRGTVKLLMLLDANAPAPIVLSLESASIVTMLIPKEPAVIRGISLKCRFANGFNRFGQVKGYVAVFKVTGHFKCMVADSLCTAKFDGGYIFVLCKSIVAYGYLSCGKRNRGECHSCKCVVCLSKEEPCRLR